MRRSTRLYIAAIVLLLVVAVGGYTAFWFIAAGRLQDGVARWAESLRDQKIDLTWRSSHVAGFPFAFDLELDDARLIERASLPAAEVAMPRLSGSTQAWDFRVWHLAAPAGLRASGSLVQGETGTLAARTAIGSVAISPDGAATLWLGLDQPEVDAGVHLAARHADLWLNFPAHPPQSHAEPTIGIALDLRDLTLPVVPVPFLNPLDEVSFGATVMGAITAAPPREAAAAWRDAGGTIELQHFTLRWGKLSIAGSGTVALDAALQPIGAFSGALEGTDELLNALVASGNIKRSDAQLAGIALSFLAKRGAAGRPQISTSFTIQQGQMFLGPARIGPAPRITWR